MTPDGTVSTMAGSTSGYLDSATGTSAEFSGLFGVGVDSSGYVYVTEATNNRVRRISPSGAVSTVAGAGAATEIDGAGNVATFNTPHGIAVDQGGTLYTADLNGETVRLIERVISAGSN
jgi:DNA-binding beta-propeller fold protein YncE